MAIGYDDSTSVPQDLPENPRDSLRPRLQALALDSLVITNTALYPERGTSPTDETDNPSYILRREVGSGSFGEVWEALQVNLNRTVAVKRPRIRTSELQLSDDSKLNLALFHKEALITGKLDHPNIVPVYDLGSDNDGRPLLAMKMVEGNSWEQLLHQDRELSMPEKLAKHIPILLQACHAVAFAHNRGIIHRDLKPAQVMVGHFGEVLLMDWGLAVAFADTSTSSITATAQFATPLSEASNPAGTVAFMAPEQTESTTARLGPWTDVYLLGGILYYILTDTYPHPQTSAASAFQHAARGIVEPPEERAPDKDIPPELGAICRQAMARDIGDRYTSVEALIEAIQTYLSGSNRRQESRVCVEEARQILSSTPDDYVNLEKCDALLVRALNLWSENEEAAQLHDELLEQFAATALRMGDRKLAALQARRITDTARQTAMSVRVDEAEKRAARLARQRKTALVSAIILLVAATGLGLSLVKTSLDAEAEAAQARTNIERIRGQQQLAMLKLQDETARRQAATRLAEVRSLTSALIDSFDSKIVLPDKLALDEDWSYLYLKSRPDIVEKFKRDREKLRQVRADLEQSGIPVEQEPYDIIIADGVVELFLASAKEGDYRRAYQHFETAAATSPERYEPFQGMAIAAARSGDLTSASLAATEAARRANDIASVEFGNTLELRSDIRRKQHKDFQPGPDDIIVEAWRGGKNNDHYVEVEGTWTDSECVGEYKSMAPGLSDYKVSASRKFLFYEPFLANPNRTPAAARFLPRTATARKYHVYVTWPGEANAAPVYYTVKHAGGEKTVPLIQDGLGISHATVSDAWISLGEYEFAPGEKHYVELWVSDNVKPFSPQRHAQVSADAVYFAAAPLKLGTVDAPLSAEAVPDRYRVRDTTGATVKINWLENLEEARERAAREKRGMAIFYYYPISSYFIHPINRYRDYCENRLFVDQAVATLLNERFVPVRVSLVDDTDAARSMNVEMPGTAICILDASLNVRETLTSQSLLLSPSELEARLFQATSATN